MTEEAMTIGELKKILDPLDDDLKVDLLVNFDNCNHIQKLRDVHIPSDDMKFVDWITLSGTTHL